MLTTENGFDLTTHNDLIYLLVREAGLPGGRCRAGAGRSCGASCGGAFWRPLPGAYCRQAGAAVRETLADAAGTGATGLCCEEETAGGRSQGGGAAA